MTPPRRNLPTIKGLSADEALLSIAAATDRDEVQAAMLAAIVSGHLTTVPRVPEAGRWALGCLTITANLESMSLGLSLAARARIVERRALKGIGAALPSDQEHTE